MLEQITPDALTSLGLTPREAEVLAWVAQGRTNAEIGTVIGIGTPTVKKHVERIFRKLGVKTRMAAVVVAARRCTASALSDKGRLAVVIESK